ncbi:LysR family transcriptional regulator [Endobacterium cereale]|uniref:LysR family transcriptional regulator n=1 Tax=Endobacterium cereale TaxID=2663029 RepID=UPI002B45A177|nr:LysR family transcriptional regulator [Endobacterium cereale]MEB2848048.1 LysR family transcriptional regulator [Endobacterium cereale]
MAEDVRIDEIYRTVSSLPPGELAAFLAVAEHGGFRGAARTLDQSASALSHSVAGLERRLKVKLLHRSTRNVSLTESGKYFAARLMPAISEVGKAIQDLQEMNQAPTSLLRINSDANAAEQVLMPLLTRFLQSQPDMRFEIVTDTALVDLAEGGFDCGFRLAEWVPDDMIAIPIGPEQQHIVVASPAYLGCAPSLNQPSDISQHRCAQLRMPSGAIYRWEFQRRGEAISIDTKGNLVVDYSRLLLAAAIEGYGLAYVTRWMAKSHLEDGTLTQVLVEWTPPYSGLSLYYPRHRHISAGMRAFLAFLRAA